MSVLMKFSLTLVSLLAISVYAIGSAYSFSFPPIIEYKGTIILVSLFGSLAIVYTYFRPEEVISPPCWSITVYSLFVPASIMLTQIVGSFNYPLTDKYLAGLDQILGFEWPAAMSAFAKLPEWVSEFSTSLYDSSMLVSVLVVLYLIFTRKNKRLDEFVTYFILAGIITVTISGFAPAESAIEYFQLDEEVYNRLSPIVGNGYMNDFYSLRDGSLRELKVIETRGIISFPSFHTINSLLLIYIMRGNGVLFALTAIWNTGIVLTTPFDGAHYLTDLIGGALVLALTIYLVRALEPHLSLIYSNKDGDQELVAQPQ